MSAKYERGSTTRARRRSRNSLHRKKTDRKWEEGDDISIPEFAATEHGRSSPVIASEGMKNKILEIGINKCARESGCDRHDFVRKLVRGIPGKE
jgi:hypothetical protein